MGGMDEGERPRVVDDGEPTKRPLMRVDDWR